MGDITAPRLYRTGIHHSRQPGQKKPDRNKINELVESLKEAEQSSVAAHYYANDPANPDSDKKNSVLFFRALMVLKCVAAGICKIILQIS